MTASHTKFDFFGLFVVLVVIVGMLGVLLPALQRDKRVNNALSDGQMLKQVHLATSVYVTNKDEVPPSWMYLIHNGTIVSEICISTNNPRREWENLEPTLGRYSVADLYDPDTTIEMLGTEAARVVPDEPWERIGDLLVSREVEAQTSFRADLVACVTLMAERRARGTYTTHLAFADNHVVKIDIGSSDAQTAEYRRIIDADRAARTELGMSDPPDYATLIRSHTAEQHRLAEAGK